MVSSKKEKGTSRRRRGVAKAKDRGNWILVPEMPETCARKRFMSERLGPMVSAPAFPTYLSRMHQLGQRRKKVIPCVPGRATGD